MSIPTSTNGGDNDGGSSSSSRSSSSSSNNPTHATGNQHTLFIVMGTSGSGKSTLGAQLSTTLSLPFIDGDDLHPASNVAKMSAGIPLTDHDREPWLSTIRTTALESCTSLIIACSALKLSYRQLLRGSIQTLSDSCLSSDSDSSSSSLSSSSSSSFSQLHESRHLRVVHIYIDIPIGLLEKRMSLRKGHFMKLDMLHSQLAILQPPCKNEKDVIIVPIDESMSNQTVVLRVVEQLKRNHLIDVS